MKKIFSCLAVVVILSALLSIFLFATSCKSNEIINDYQYFEENSRYKTITDLADYSFEKDISLKKRNRLVTFSEQLLQHLKLQETEDKTLSINVSKSLLAPRAESENCKVFLSTSDTKTVEFIHTILQVLNTNTLNYGLLYGLSSRIYDELGWGKINTISDTKTQSFLGKEKNRYILDLTYPVFHKKFSSKEQIKYAKAISVKLVDYISNIHGEQAIEQLFKADLTFDLSFDHLFYGYLNEWLDIIKIENVQINKEVLRCVPYTSDFPIRIITNSCDYYMDKNWVDSHMQDYYEYKDFEFNYPSVKRYLLKTEASYRLVREFFDYTEKIRYPVHLQNGSDDAGHVTTDGKHIVINTMYALTHEYAHFTSFVMYEISHSWMLEAIAYYCGYILDDLMSNDAFFAYSERNEYIKKTSLSEYSIFVLDNYVALSNNDNYYLRYINAYNYGKFFDEVNLYSNFDEFIAYPYLSVGFSDYLIKTYGKEKYIELYKESANLYKVYNKSKAELIEGYLDYLYYFFN